MPRFCSHCGCEIRGHEWKWCKKPKCQEERVKAWKKYISAYKKKRKPIVEKREVMIKKCTYCHMRPVAPGKHFFCSQCFHRLGNEFAPEATGYWDEW